MLQIGVVCRSIDDTKKMSVHRSAQVKIKIWLTSAKADISLSVTGASKKDLNLAYYTGWQNLFDKLVTPFFGTI